MALLWNYLKRYKKLLFLALFLATVNQVFSLLDPQIFRLIVDRYATQVHALSSDKFIFGVLGLLGLSVGAAFVSRVAKNFQDYHVNVIVQRLGAQMYAHSVEHSFSLPYATFEDQRSGEFLQKLQKAKLDSQQLVLGSINSVFLALVGIIFVVLYAFTVHPVIGLVYFLIIPSLGIVTFAISRKIKTAQRTIINETAALAGSTTETLRNVELVKSLGLEDQEIRRLNDVNEAILQLELKKVRLVRKFSFIQGTLINALRSALMFLMLWFIFQGSITLGQFFSLLFYSFAIFSPLGDLGTVAQTYQEAKASLERLDEILKLKPQEKPKNPVALASISKIVFTGVSFNYETNRTVAVSNINLEIGAGETVAFVGPSGAGKTTLVKLLVGLYRPTSGEIYFNNYPIGLLDLASLRSRLGLVAQDTQLFAGTIRENLLFSRPDASDDECWTALRLASATGILDRGQAGLDTRIGEGGLRLSGGERQRLAIARALLRNPDLIIFDEATSSLDSLTEAEITETIKSIRTHRPDLITVMVAHRLSTVSHADRIYVLERGSIIEKGNHAMLLSGNGLYAALWRQQIASAEINPKFMR